MFGLYWSFKFSKVKFSTTVGLLHVFPLVRSGSFKKVKFSKMFGLLQVCPPVMREPVMVERGVELSHLLLRPMTTS